MVLAGEAIYGDAITALYQTIVDQAFAQGSGSLQQHDLREAYLQRIASDVVLREFAEANPWLHYAAATAGALAVLGVGKYFQTKHANAEKTDESA